MRVDRDAAAVVAHRERAVGLEADLDPVGVAGDRLVHGVVEQLGRQMVQRALVGAADEHAGPPAHRLQALEDLDVGGGVEAARAAPAGEEGPRAPSSVPATQTTPRPQPVCVPPNPAPMRGGLLPPRGETMNANQPGEARS